MHSEELLHEIKDLYETNRLAEARKYLALGWRLLKIVAKREEGEYASFVLGWPSVQPPNYPNRDGYFSNSTLMAG